MKKMSFTGTFCASAYMAKAEASSEEASLRYAQGQEAAKRYAALKQAEELKKARRAAKRQQRNIASAEERETLSKLNYTVFRTVRAWNREVLFKAALPLIKMAKYRLNKEYSAQLGDALWASIKEQMTSHSYEDNWSFGQLKHSIFELREELMEAFNDTEDSVLRHGYLWVYKYLKISFVSNKDYRDLMKVLNFSERK